MAVTPATTTSFELERVAELDAPAPETWELDAAPRWPQTRLTSWSLTLLLAAGLYMPAVAGYMGGVRSLLLLMPALVTTLSVRALFETLGSAATGRSRTRQVAAAVVPGVMAGVLMAGACVIVTPPWSPLIGIVTVVVATVTLVTAEALTGVEIRFRRGRRRVYFVGSRACLKDLQGEIARQGDRQLVGATTFIRRTGTFDPISFLADALAARPTVLVFDRDAIGASGLETARQLSRSGVGVLDLVSYYEQEFKKVPLSELTSAWFQFDAAVVHRRRLHAALRRALEVSAAGVLLIASAPLILILAAAIRLSSRGPALYRQPRVGKAGTTFTLLKLRTMTEDTGGAAAWASSQAHRVTRLGRQLRRFRVDELPQLWNVVRGDLAFIGPRPEQVPIVEQLDRELLFYSARHCIRPGITGWAQVNLGYGGSISGTLAKLQRDLYYVKHSSFRLDALIVWLTLKAVFAGRG